MRIVLFAPHFAEYATRLALALAKDAKILLFLDGQNRRNECDNMLMSEARKAVSVVEFCSRGRVRRLLSRLLVPLRARLFRPDVVHVQEQTDPLTASIVRLMGGRGRIMLTVHDPNPHTGNDRAYAARTDRHKRFLRGCAAAYHVHGAYCDALLASNWKGKPVTSTAHGVILVPEAERRTKPEPGRILLFGRMEAYKGIGVLLAAAEILRAKGLPFRLVFAGRGPELDRVRPAAAKYDDIEVIAKFLTPEETITEFQRASIVVVPYLDATQSGVVAAAFGNGRPVVASRVGGLVDAVRDGVDGLMAPPNDPEALAKTLARLLCDEDLRSLLAAGAREAAKGTFSWSSVGETLMAAYNELQVQ